MLTALETLCHLLEEGIPAGEAFLLLAADNSGRTGPDWYAGARILEQGGSLSTALSKSLPRLSAAARPFYLLADCSARPGRVLSALVRLLQRDKEVSNRIGSAALYPVSVLLLGQTGGGLFLLFGLPGFLARLSLPPPPFTTTILPWMMATLAAAGLLLPPVLIPRLRKLIPFFGKIYRLREEYRLFRFLGILTAEGYPLAEAVGLCRELFDDRDTRQRLTRIAAALDTGAGSTAAFLTGGLSAEIRLWIRAGEATGRTGTVLTRIAGGLERNLRQELRRLLPLAEPLFLLLAGAFLLPVLLSVITPLLTLMETAG
jgi:general secretion pathway protein F